jgi:dihydroneopterin aldolase / 2-amino-4-hydroxy-6-hydroxymethyldihydropteridine diphosphokinase / dihydropteroate synthase
MLLDLFKNIKRTVGRVPSIRNGQRAVDLDILFSTTTPSSSTPDPSPQRDIGRSRGTPCHPSSSDGGRKIRPAAFTKGNILLSPLLLVLIAHAAYSMVPGVVLPVLRKPIHEMLCDGEDIILPSMIKVMPFPVLPHSTGLTASPPPSVTDVSQVPYTRIYLEVPHRQICCARRTGAVYVTPKASHGYST